MRLAEYERSDQFAGLKLEDLSQASVAGVWRSDHCDRRGRYHGLSGSPGRHDGSLEFCLANSFHKRRARSGSPASERERFTGKIHSSRRQAPIGLGWESPWLLGESA
jgi:hypothetical protein